MRYPDFLPAQGTIAFAAPSFGCNTEPYRTAFQSALQTFARLGHPAALGPNVYEGSGIGISASPQRCGKELTESYLDPGSQALISCGGGELMCEILDHVDFEAIKAGTPKWFMGYSDNTNFTFLLPTICDVAAIYGPCAPAFGMQPWHEAIHDAYQLLRGQKLTQCGYPLYEEVSLKDETHPLMPYYVTRPRMLRAFLPAGDEPSGVTQQRNASHSVLRPAQGEEEIHFSGRLLGGCMDCLVNLTGTVYDHVAAFTRRYAQDGIIWFLEACDLNVYAIRRAIWQMQHAGWFANVTGFLIGRPLNPEPLFGLDAYRAVTDLLARYHVPVLMDLDIGHIPPMMPLICGAAGEVTCSGQQLQIQMRTE